MDSQDYLEGLPALLGEVHVRHLRRTVAQIEVGMLDLIGHSMLILQADRQLSRLDQPRIWVGLEGQPRAILGEGWADR